MKNKKLFAILTLVCFMMTLMPVAAFAAVNVQNSFVYTEKSNPTIGSGEDTGVTFSLRDDAGLVTSPNATTVYVWFVASGLNVPSTMVSAQSAGDDYDVTPVAQGSGIFAVDAATDVTAGFKFNSPGVYTLYAATKNPLTNNGDTIADKIAKNADFALRTLDSQKTVNVTQSNILVDNYRTDVTVDGSVKGSALANGGKTTSVSVTSNAVSAKETTVKFYEVKADGSFSKAISGKNVSITTNSANVQVSDESLTTNALGNITFDITGSAAGDYQIYVTCGNYEITIPVSVGATSAAYITTDKAPEAPIALNETDLKDKVQFAITDINGNDMNGSFDGATFANTSNTSTNADYVKFVTKPAASRLKNSALSLSWDGTKKVYYLDLNGNALDAEGTYEVRVALNNGNYATVTFEVKEFQRPVKLELTYKQEAIELGGTAVIDDLQYVDANGTTKKATDAKLAASGYAISTFYTAKTTSNEKGDIVVKSDEKYIGSEITVSAVSERYNLVATAKIKVTADAAELAFASKTGEVNVNNKIDVQIVDAEGNKVAPTNVTNAEISYVILDKPEGALVSATTVKSSDLADKGTFTMALTSNKIGNVAVQAIAKVTIKAENNNDANVEVVKYYTGTQIFAIGTGSAGDVVVMSIGSHEIVVNDKTATIDAAPMIQNDRTFVPFRALAEAFGAEVAYDEATQAVTAKLNGVEVVMTIGSATYTVNGAEKTADVAPFINGSRTMVPVRFAAEAFGIKVIPTYNPDGTTADILFNL